MQPEPMASQRPTGCWGRTGNLCGPPHTTSRMWRRGFGCHNNLLKPHSKPAKRQKRHRPPKCRTTFKGRCWQQRWRMARPYARTTRRIRARTRQTLVPSECTYAPSYRNQDGHVVANTALVCAASSVQCLLIRLFQQPPSPRPPWCRQPLVRRPSSAGRGPRQVGLRMMKSQKPCAQLSRKPEAELLRRHRLRRQQLQPQRRLRRPWQPPPSQWQRQQLPNVWQPLESHRSKRCPRKAMAKQRATPWTGIWKDWESVQGQPRPRHASGSLGRGAVFTWRDFQWSRRWISSPRLHCRSVASRMVLRAGGGWPSRVLSWWPLRRLIAKSATSSGQMCGQQWRTRFGMAMTSWCIASKGDTGAHSWEFYAGPCWKANPLRRRMPLWRIAVIRSCTRWSRTRAWGSGCTRPSRRPLWGRSILSPKGMQPQSAPQPTSRSRMASLCASTSRPMGRRSAWWTRTCQLTFTRLWRGSVPGATSACDAHRRHGGHQPDSQSRIFGLCAD